MMTILCLDVVSAQWQFCGAWSDLSTDGCTPSDSGA